MTLRLILQKVNSSPDLSKENLIDRIKDKLQQENRSIYDEWKESEFDINYMFIVLKCNLLLTAAENGYEKVVRYLTKNGANVNVQDEWEKTSLHYSAQHGHMKIVKLLLKNGANVNLQNKNRYTPLSCAWHSKYPEIAKLLLNYGADPSCIHRPKAMTAGITVGVISAVVVSLVLAYATALPVLAIIEITAASALIVGGISYGVAYKSSEHSLNSKLSEVS